MSSERHPCRNMVEHMGFSGVIRALIRIATCIPPGRALIRTATCIPPGRAFCRPRVSRGAPGYTGDAPLEPGGSTGVSRWQPLGMLLLYLTYLAPLVVYVSSIWVVMTQHTEGNGGEQGGGSYHTRVQFTLVRYPFVIGSRTPTAASHRGLQGRSPFGVCIG